MGFFDELSDMANNVKKGAQDSLDISKYNSNIKAEERRIAELKSAIGEKYFELFKDKPAPELKGLIDDINNCLAVIEENNKKINQINEAKKVATTAANGGVVCKNCGASNAADAAFCVNCGKPIEKEAKPAVVLDGVTCKKCGTVNDKESAFCVNCGSPLEKETAEEAKKAPKAKKETKKEEKSTKTCPKCGAENEATMSFCTECGTKLDKE